MLETLGANGIFGSVRRLGATAIAIVQNRLELLVLELQEEKARVIGVLIWGSCLLFFGFMMFVALTFGLVVLFWEHAVVVLFSFAGFYLVAAAIALFRLRARLKNPPYPFFETVQQLKKDREWLHSEA